MNGDSIRAQVKSPLAWDAKTFALAIQALVITMVTVYHYHISPGHHFLLHVDVQRERERERERGRKEGRREVGLK